MDALNLEANDWSLVSSYEADMADWNSNAYCDECDFTATEQALFLSIFEQSEY